MIFGQSWCLSESETMVECKNSSNEAPSKKWRLFPHSLKPGRPCDLLWPTEYTRNEVVLVPSLGLKRSCSFHSGASRTWSYHVKEPGLVGWRMRNLVEGGTVVSAKAFRDESGPDWLTSWSQVRRAPSDHLTQSRPRTAS